MREAAVEHTRILRTRIEMLQGENLGGNGEIRAALEAIRQDLDDTAHNINRLADSVQFLRARQEQTTNLVIAATAAATTSSQAGRGLEVAVIETLRDR